MSLERDTSLLPRAFAACSEFIRGESAFAQAIRYLLSGGIVYATDVALFLAFYWGLGSGPQLANVTAKLLAAALGFVLHRHFTYAGDHRDGVSRQGAKYLALLIFNILFSALLVFLFVDVLAQPVVPFRILSDVIVIVNSYLCMRFIVFRVKIPSQDGRP